LVTLQALHELWLDSFFEKHPQVYQVLQENLKKLSNSCKTLDGVAVAKAHKDLLTKMMELDLKKLIEDFDIAQDKYPMYKWARMYMQQFIRSTCQQQWGLHLASLEQLCVWFFAYNQLDYAMNIP
jgi:hypothetical protein